MTHAPTSSAKHSAEPMRLALPRCVSDAPWSRRFTGSEFTPQIELTVKAPDRLFHELDPSPLVGRNLDEQVENYILASARDQPSRRYALSIHVPTQALPDKATAEALSSAIRAYFAERADAQAKALRALMAEGRQALAVGVGFLFLCGALGLIALQTLSTPFGAFLDEGLLIIGWVANWRPVEIFLYDRRPVRRERQMLDALSRVPVDFRVANAKPTPALNELGVST